MLFFLLKFTRIWYAFGGHIFFTAIRANRWLKKSLQRLPDFSTTNTLVCAAYCL